MQLAGVRSHQPGPAATAATDVHDLRVGGQRPEVHEGEVALEMVMRLGFVQSGLVEALPFVTETGHRGGVKVTGPPDGVPFRVLLHGRSLGDPNAVRPVRSCGALPRACNLPAADQRAVAIRREHMAEVFALDGKRI